MPTNQHTPMILTLLDGMDFPVAKPDIIAHAEARDASSDVLAALRGLPNDDYQNLEELTQHVGDIEALPGQENLWSSAPAP